MILSDGGLRDAIARGDLSVVPLIDAHVQPASIDLTLGDEFLCYKLPAPSTQVFDPWSTPAEDRMFKVKLKEGEPFLLQAGYFALGTTQESVRIGGQLVGRVDGRSSVGRIGVMVHSTAGFIDPGFEGQITLELFNLSPYSIALWPGKRVAQLSIHLMDKVASESYGDARHSKYLGQTGPVASRLHLDRK